MRAKRILMATMSMGIGGAETHILELCKALQKRGHAITVASNGGLYVPELEAAGISHVEIPLHRRNAGSLLRSYFTLRRLIKKERFDLVHAHARIPSFLCGLVRKCRSFPFVTTAHGAFTPGGLAGKLTTWGDASLAVSEDIKAYLMENYNVPEEKIFTTVNGIDMERFSPEVSGDSVREELAIPQTAPVIAHVSRLDEAPSVVAQQLMEISEALLEAWPDLHVIITGGGDQLERLREEAGAINEVQGRTVIHMTGPRTDIGKVIAASDVFCGVSRAALEAMSTGKPVVLAGQQGYGGIFDESKLALSRDTNFCYRGEALPTREALLKDLLACLAMDVAAREAHGQYGREVVQRHYSVEAMADDAERAYRAVTVRPKRLLVSGYYGFHNAGDEAILGAFMQSVRDLDPPVRVTVLSKTPKSTAKKYGCRAVYRFGLFAVLKALHQCDVLISGGGSLLQDKSSTRSIVYYLSIIRLAKCLKKPVMLYANGIGPVDRPRNRRRVYKVVGRADMITLREESSRDELLRMGIDGPEMHVTADPIFLFAGAEASKAAQALKQAGIPEDKPLIGISVRRLRLGADFISQMADVGDRLTQELGYTVVFIAMQMPNDLNISREVVEKMTSPAYILGGDLSPQALISISSRMDLVITMRLHTMLFAAKARTPVIGLICDPKIEYFLEKLEMPSGGAVEDFHPERLMELVKEILAEKEAYQSRLTQRVDEMDRLAADNGRYLEQLLQSL